MSLWLIVLTPFFGAGLILAYRDRTEQLSIWIAAAVTIVTLACLLLLSEAPFHGQTLIQRLSWIPDTGIDLALRLDGFSLLFAALILLIGILVIFYARYYLSAHENLPKFYASLLLFMGAMLGVALSENIIQLLIFWELTSLASFLLISYWSEETEARNGARMALTVTGLGGLALLGGFVLLGDITHSYDLSVILVSGDMIRADARYLPTLLLIVLGVFSKSAQFPLHFWLPNAMAAPTPASAYLHSATMVKAGVFLLARLFPALSGTMEWSLLVGGIGLVTLLFGAFITLFQYDLKGLLAYSTISHLGLITMLFGIGTPLAAVAGVFHIINHAIFKASLFMAVGIIDHEAGSRDMRYLSGLWKFMPYTAILAMVAAGAMAGVPLLNGFLSKEMFFTEAAGLTTQMRFGWLLPPVVTISGMFAVAYSIRFVHDVFFGEPFHLDGTPHEAPRWMLVPVEILVALCLLVGIFPEQTIQPILAIASSAVLQGQLPHYNLAVWHGFNAALWMSVLAFSGGSLIYIYRKPLFMLYERNFYNWQMQRVYEYLLSGLFRITRGITQGLDVGSLQRPLFIFILCAFCLGIAGYLSAAMPLTGSRSRTAVDIVVILSVFGLITAALSVVLLHHQRIIALILTGMAGLMSVLIFVKFSAPDLALTQLSVEVVTVILLLSALYFLPQQTPIENDYTRQGWQALLAISVGGGAAALAWGVMTRPYETIANYFLENSVSGGGGTNVVNVILVDFRGYDTLGEISVLALAALGICAMMATLRLDAPKYDANGRAWDADAHPLMLSILTRLLLPMSLLVSLYIFIRGHSLPGGGFIAGLITTVALITQYLASGVMWTEQRISWNLPRLMGLGLLIATVTGLSSWIFGYPFLTSTFTHIHVWLLGELELASAMVFDLGVYLTVVGTTLLILIHLGALHDGQQLAALHRPLESR